MDGRDASETSGVGYATVSVHENSASLQSVTNAGTLAGDVVSDNANTFALDWQRFTELNASTASITETNPSAWNRFVAENTGAAPAALTSARAWDRFVAENAELMAKPNIATPFGIRSGIGITGR